MNKIINKIKKLFTGENLKNRVFRGSSIVGLGSGVDQVARLIRNMILTRLLVPEAFGTVAIVLTLNVLFESITEVGIKENIIQNPNGDKKEYLNSAFLITTLRSILLYFFAFFSAPFIAAFYNNPELTPMMRIAFLAILFNGFLSINTYASVKRMKFFQWILINNFSKVIGIIITIILAYYYHTAWVLIYGFTLEFFFRFLFSYIFCPFLFTFKFKKEYFHSIFKYSRGMFGLPILTFLFMKIDIFVLGKLCSNNDVGLYSMASSLAMAPTAAISTILTSVLMPAFSNIQNDYKRINESLQKGTFFLSACSIPLVFFVFYYSKEILQILYTPEYTVVFFSFSILFFTYILRTLSVPIATVYLAINRPGQHRLFTIIRFLIIAIIIIPLVKMFSVLGAALAVFISLLISYIVQVFQLNRLTKIDIFKYFKNLSIFFVFSQIIGIGWLIKKVTKMNFAWLNLSIGIFLLIITFIMIAKYVFKNKNNTKMFSN